MSNTESFARPCAFGGGPLAGENIVRKAFLDEAGVSHPEQEPFVVTAGVIINMDRQWKALEAYLWAMIEDQFPPEKRDGAFFHAYALYGGNTPFDEAHGWPETRRFECLEELASIPEKFGLPIVYAYSERAKLANYPPNAWIKDITMQAQVITASACIQQVERYMKRIDNDELAEVIMEDSQKVRKYVKQTYRFLRNPPPWYMTSLGPDERHLPLQKVVHTPHFEEKEDASLLQIADVCAYVIKRRVMRDPKIERFFKPMRNNIAYANTVDPSNPMYKPWEEA